MFGLYIHWPFCLSKCIYCDFGSRILTKEQCNSDFQDKYCECCKQQMNYFAKKIQHNQYQKELTSIYFGGGTPSLLKPNNVKQLIQEAKNLFNVSPDCEITLEANPTSFELEKFMLFRDAGINRLSLGVQSFDNDELLWLGRRHTAQQAVDAINAIKTIFPKWSFDLIYGLPRQTIDKWKNELQLALSLSPHHLSLYTLIVDAKTPLGIMVQQGSITPKTEDEMADFYDTTNKIIKNSLLSDGEKIHQYEVSNYAVNGCESIHNLCYWKSYDYIGIGSMAHGRLRYFDGERYEIVNTNNIKDWMLNENSPRQQLSLECKLSKQENVEEIMIMGLRMHDGISMNDIYERFGMDVMNYVNQEQINTLINDGCIIFKDGILRLTYKGIKTLDTILQKILI